jgi:hypothetical protein
MASPASPLLECQNTTSTGPLVVTDGADSLVPVEKTSPGEKSSRTNDNNKKNDCFCIRIISSIT